MSALENGPTNDWEPCPEGTLAGTVRGIQRRRNRREFVGLGIVAVGVFALFALIGLVVQPFGSSPGFDHGNITCAETKPLLPDYLAGKLDEETTARISKHLAACPDCKPLFEKMQSSVGATASLRMRGDPDCAACRDDCAVCREHGLCDIAKVTRRR